MRQVFLVIDSECASYVGPDKSMQGYDGQVVHETPNGKWVMFRDYFLHDERVIDTAWAYEYQESILPQVFGRVTGKDSNIYSKPWVSMYFPNDRIHRRRYV